MMHRARQLLIRQRTMIVNALRAHIAELGMVRARSALKSVYATQLELNGKRAAALWQLCVRYVCGTYCASARHSWVYRITSFG